MSEQADSIMKGLQEMLDHAQEKVELKANYVSTTPPKEFTADEIKEIRNGLNMSQGFFADVIGVSKRTVVSWEYGKGKPNGAAARMLTIAVIDPDALKRYGFANYD